MIKYQYQILRYVHDQFTGEFGNIGIVLYAPENNFLSCKVTNRYSRLSDFFGEINGHFLIASIKQFESCINEVAAEHNKQYTNTDLSKITSIFLSKDDSALQLTDTSYGIDVDPKIALHDLFERIVEKYNNDVKAIAHTDQHAWRKFYKAYFDKYNITKKLKKHTIETTKDSINFDKAWKNGVWNCYQTLSFDLKSEDSIKSKVYKWSGIIRELETTNEKLKIHFLTTSPKEHTELKSFIKETLTFNDKTLVVNIIEEDKAEDFAASVRKEMEQSKIIDTDEDESPF